MNLLQLFFRLTLCVISGIYKIGSLTQFLEINKCLIIESMPKPHASRVQLEN